MATLANTINTSAGDAHVAERADDAASTYTHQHTYTCAGNMNGTGTTANTRTVTRTAARTCHSY